MSCARRTIFSTCSQVHRPVLYGLVMMSAWLVTVTFVLTDATAHAVARQAIAAAPPPAAIAAPPAAAVMTAATSRRVRVPLCARVV